MEETIGQLKDLPWALKNKSMLYEMYGRQMSDRAIREAINAIITENRKGKNLNVRAHFVCHAEFKEFVQTFGVPKGYKHEKWVDN